MEQYATDDHHAASKDSNEGHLFLHKANWNNFLWDWHAPDRVLLRKPCYTLVYFPMRLAVNSYATSTSRTADWSMHSSVLHRKWCLFRAPTRQDRLRCTGPIAEPKWNDICHRKSPTPRTVSTPEQSNTNQQKSCHEEDASDTQVSILIFNYTRQMSLWLDVIKIGQTSTMLLSCLESMYLSYFFAVFNHTRSISLQPLFVWITVRAMLWTCSSHPFMSHPRWSLQTSEHVPAPSGPTLLNTGFLDLNQPSSSLTR